MSLIKWMDSKVKKFKGIDISLIKITTAAIVLLIAKYWPVLISFDAWVYIVVAVLAAIRPLKIMFS